MRVKLFPIPAKQALAQNVDAIEEGYIIGMNTNGTAVLELEDHTLVCVSVEQLQVASVSEPEKLPATEPLDDSKVLVDKQYLENLESHVERNPEPKVEPTTKAETPLSEKKARPGASKPGKA